MEGGNINESNMKFYKAKQEVIHGDLSAGPLLVGNSRQHKMRKVRKLYLSYFLYFVFSSSQYGK